MFFNKRSTSCFAPCGCKRVAQNKVCAMEKKEEPVNTGPKKGGRPRVAVHQKKRITINCRSAEYRVIRTKAEKAKLSVSQFCLKSAMGKPLPKIHTSERIDEIRQLAGMAHNLNQIAKSVNSGERLKFSALKDLEAISKILKQLQE